MPKPKKESTQAKEFLKKQKTEEVSSESESESEHEIVMVKKKPKKVRKVDNSDSDYEGPPPTPEKKRRVDYTEHFMKLNNDLEHIKTELSTFKNFQAQPQTMRSEEKIGELELMRRRMALKF